LRLESEVNALSTLQASTLTRVRLPKILGYGQLSHGRYLIIEPLPETAKPIKLTTNKFTLPFFAEYEWPRRWLGSDEIQNLSWWIQYQDKRPKHDSMFLQQVLSLLHLGADVCRVHGDLSLSNMVSDGNQIWLFDWESSHPAAPVMTDPIGYYLSFRIKQVLEHPVREVQLFYNEFVHEQTPTQQLGAMLALMFRHSADVPDATTLINCWESVRN